MRIQISDPEAASELLDALAAAECVAEQTADDVLEVDVPWVDGEDDERQAHIELSFFVSAWQAGRPGLAAVVTP
jgi:hypothetical protein